MPRVKTAACSFLPYVQLINEGQHLQTHLPQQYAELFLDAQKSLKCSHLVRCTVPYRMWIIKSHNAMIVESKKKEEIDNAIVNSNYFSDSRLQEFIIVAGRLVGSNCLGAHLHNIIKTPLVQLLPSQYDWRSDFSYLLCSYLIQFNSSD